VGQFGKVMRHYFFEQFACHFGNVTIDKGRAEEADHCKYPKKKPCQVIESAFVKNVEAMTVAVTRLGKRATLTAN